MEASKPVNINLSIVHAPFSSVIDQQRMDELAQFELRNDDLFIVTYPKCGTTWMQQLVKLIRARGVDDNVHPIESLEALDAIQKLPGKPPVDFKVNYICSYNRKTYFMRNLRATSLYVQIRLTNILLKF